jgi:hypothetical protein
MNETSGKNVLESETRETSLDIPEEVKVRGPEISGVWRM